MAMRGNLSKPLSKRRLWINAVGCVLMLVVFGPPAVSAVVLAFSGAPSTDPHELFETRKVLASGVLAVLLSVVALVSLVRTVRALRRARAATGGTTDRNRT